MLPVRSCMGTASTERVEYWVAASNRWLNARVGCTPIACASATLTTSPVCATWPARLDSLSRRGSASKRCCVPACPACADEVVLHHRELEPIALAQEERAGLGAQEPPRRLENSFEQGVEVALARQRDADVDELVETCSRSAIAGNFTGRPPGFWPRRLASYSARSAAMMRSSTVVESSGRLATPRLAVTGVCAEAVLLDDVPDPLRVRETAAFDVFTRMIANSSPP